MNKLISIFLSVIAILLLMFIVEEVRRPGLGKYMIEQSYSFIFKTRIKEMFKKNMVLVHWVLNICDTISDENKATQEINFIMDDVVKLLNKYPYLNNQRLVIDNEFGPDWAGTIHTQWTQALYLLKKNIDSSQGKIKVIAINSIMNTLNISLKELNERVMAMTYLDQHTKAVTNPIK